MSGIHSTGRGGAGNIGESEVTYVDGDIVREGQPYEGGEYRGGRGGAGNTAFAAPPASSTEKPAPAAPVGSKSEDVIPEPAMRTAEGHENFYTGRGGSGNVHRAEFGGHSHAQHKSEGLLEKAEGLLDKAKQAIGLDKEKSAKPESS